MSKHKSALTVMKSRNQLFFALGTQAVHAGEENKKYSGSVSFPIFQTTNFKFEDTAALYSYLKGGSPYYLYTRYTNPTFEAVERKMAELEGAEAAVLFSSGMAAISSAILTFARGGNEIIAIRNLYGGTFQLLTQVLPGFGIKTHFIDTEQVEQAQKFLNKKTALIYLESPTNPNNRIVDIHRAVEVAKSRKVPVIMDNSFSTPVNQRPLDLGVDVVVYSATKYIAGHSDITAGFVVGNKKFCGQVAQFRKILGGCLDPIGAWLLLRGMKTLVVRMAQHNRNGLRVAEFLAQHPRVKHVFYPGLVSDPAHTLAKKQMRGFGGMVCFEIFGGLKAVARVLDHLQIIMHATSLGGVESVASIPVLTSHIQFSPAELKRAGVTKGMIRLSCGIEEPEDLVDDLDRALRATK